MPTLAEKIEAVVREAFPCLLNCREQPNWPTEGHYSECPMWHALEVLIVSYNAANLAIEEAISVAGVHAKDCGCSTAIIADLRAPALPKSETKKGVNTMADRRDTEKTTERTTEKNPNPPFGRGTERTVEKTTEKEKKQDE